MNLTEKIMYKLLSVQEKFLKKRLSKTIGIKNSSKRKKHFFGGCTLDLNSLADVEKQKLEDEITNILKTYNFEPEKILHYIETQGTKVFYIQNAAKLLNSIGYNEGFIPPYKGAKALYLALATEKKFKLKTDEMFVLSKGAINKYYFIYNFYNWYAYKHGIAGLDRKSSELLNKYLFTNSDTKELQLSDIYQLKDAIKQDKSAIEFVVKLCRNYEGTKQALNKMATDGSAKL